MYLNNTTLTGTYEAINSIIVEGNVTVGGTTTLKAGNNIHLKPGYTAPSGIDFTAQIGAVTNTPKRFYYLKDHLGSIRVVVDEAANIVSSDDYDPWGMILNGRSTDIAYLNAKYKFTGKELDTGTNYYHFAARPYDGRIGRWMQIDPLTEESPGISPYVYANNNPISILDLFGMDTTFVAQLPEVVVKAKRDNDVQQAQIVPVPLPEPIPLPVPPLPGTFDRPIKDWTKLLNEISNLINNFPIMVGKPGFPPVPVSILNLSSADDSKTVNKVLKGKKGSIKNAPLPAGSPSWQEIEKKTMGEIKEGANKNLPGYKTIKKLLGDKRFDK